MRRLAGLVLAGSVLAAPAVLRAAPEAAAPADPAALESGRSLLRAGNRAKALEAAKALVAAAPSDVEAHLLYQDAARGQVPLPILLADYQGRATREPGGVSTFLLSRLQNPAEAEKALRDAVGKDPKHYWLQVGLASALLRLGRAVPAESTAMAALELRPSDARAAMRAGGQCAEARKFGSAETCYRKALAADPNLPGAAVGLAHALLRQKKVEEAQAVFTALPEEKTPSASRLLFAAALAAEKGDPAAAEDALKRALAVSPADTDAQMQLALLHLRKAEAAVKEPGKKVPASAVSGDLSTLQKCSLAMPERGDIRYAMGYAREITGDADGALTEYREATRLDPLDGDSLAALAAVLMSKGLLDDAAREFLRALDRDPDDGMVLANLAYVYDQQGKTKEALDAYQKLVRLEPKNARAWHGLGLAMDAAGKAKESLAPLQKAVDLDPTEPRFQRDLAEVLFLQRSFDRAAEILEKVVAADPKDDYAWDALGRCRDQQRKYDAAVAAYEKVAELREKDADVQILLGMLYHEYLKDYEKAKEHYNKYLALGGEEPSVTDWITECDTEIARKKN